MGTGGRRAGVGARPSAAPRPIAAAARIGRRDPRGPRARALVETGVARAHPGSMCPITYAGAVQLDEFRWMLPKEGGMRVPGVLFADRPLLEKMLSDRTPQQVRNAAHLPGILEASIAMPDAHWGYGLPVGGVVATDPEEGGISPGAAIGRA